MRPKIIDIALLRKKDHCHWIAAKFDNCSSPINAKQIRSLSEGTLWFCLLWLFLLGILLFWGLCEDKSSMTRQQYHQTYNSYELWRLAAPFSTVWISFDGQYFIDLYYHIILYLVSAHWPQCKTVTITNHIIFEPPIPFHTVRMSYDSQYKRWPAVQFMTMGILSRI